LKLYFMLARRRPDVPSQLVLEVCEILRQRGVKVACGIAEETLLRPDRPFPKVDLYLLKSYTELSLSLAGVLHRQGARLLNPYPGCYAARNKIIASQVLAAAAIPAPRCWVTSDFTLLGNLLNEAPIIVKPYMGWRGEGVHVVRNQAELATLPFPQSPVLVQEYLPGSGEDLRLYIAGEEVFAVAKPFSGDSFARPGRPVPVTTELRRIGLSCGAAFGLGLYGVDLIETESGPKVIDVNYFPGFKGVKGASEVVADYVQRCAEGVCDLPGIVVATEASPARVS